MGILLVALSPEEIDEHVRARVRALAGNRRVVYTTDRAEIERLLPELEIVAGFFPSEWVVRAPQLRWYQQWGAGADWLMEHPQAIEKDFILTNASGVHTIPISEHIIGMLLALGRGLHHAAQAQARHEWWRPSADTVFELSGKTMLLIGVGAIGARTAAIAAALGMRVEGVRSNPERPADGVAAMFGPQQLAERLPNADVVVLTVPLSPDTRAMIGETEFHLMKPSAIIVNIGRGGTIDEPALIAALRDGHIAGAALDVFAQEPLPADSPLWDMPNVFLTSHYSGINPLYNERAMAIFLDNLERFEAGSEMRNVVDTRAGY
jgi:phosphoglycerate dehydrogenase-like enzyme